MTTTHTRPETPRHTIGAREVSDQLWQEFTDTAHAAQFSTEEAIRIAVAMFVTRYQRKPSATI